MPDGGGAVCLHKQGHSNPGIHSDATTDTLIFAMMPLQVFLVCFSLSGSSATGRHRRISPLETAQGHQKIMETPAGFIGEERHKAGFIHVFFPLISSRGKACHTEWACLESFHLE